jgi:hypothetical protein
MKERNYNKYTSFIDRFPFIIVALIVVLAIILVFQLKVKFPLPFFSGNISATQDEASDLYPILVASPNNEEVFDFVSNNEYVPIEIKSKKIEGLDYDLNLVVNDKDIVKTFSSSPYKYNWHPARPGEYMVLANLVDNSNKIISSSNKIRFIVNFKYEEKAAADEAVSLNMMPVMEETSLSSIPIIYLEIFEGPIYSAGDDICYYRVKAKVTGDPKPVVSFSKDDSGSAWGPFIAQINLTRDNPNYTLTAIAKNSAGQTTSSITLNWGCMQ